MAAGDAFDIAVLGSGPAGLAFAARAVQSGLTVCSIDPSHARPWHCTYCTWVDELKGTWVWEQCGAALFDKICTSVAVVWQDGRRQVLPRQYGRI
eukprot:SAG31_NODE_5775_length_2332_cov_1.669503_4_plen_94_part_01